MNRPLEEMPGTATRKVVAIPVYRQMDGNRQKTSGRTSAQKGLRKILPESPIYCLSFGGEACGVTGDHDRQEVNGGNIQAEWVTNLAKDKIIVYGKGPTATHPKEAHLDSTKNRISALAVSNRNIVPRWLL
ncbi:MAG: hypothetical protein ACREUR_01085 [Nitrosospira sp.]